MRSIATLSILATIVLSACSNSISLESSDAPISVSGLYGYSSTTKQITLTIDQSYDEIPDQSRIDREVHFSNPEEAWEMLGYETVDFPLDDCDVNSGSATLHVLSTSSSDEVELVKVIENTNPFCAFD